MIEINNSKEDALKISISDNFQLQLLEKFMNYDAGTLPNTLTWNEVMPMVIKCIKDVYFEHMFDSSKWACTLKDNSNGMINAYHSMNISVVYSALIDFITFFNTKT